MFGMWEPLEFGEPFDIRKMLRSLRWRHSREESGQPPLRDLEHDTDLCNLEIYSNCQWEYTTVHL